MKKKELRWMFVAIVIAGFLGGALSGLLRAEPVFAQKKSAPARSIKAENFELVDNQGRTRAKLTMGEDEEPTLIAYDLAGKPIAAYGLPANGGPLQNLLGQFLSKPSGPSSNSPPP